MRDISLDLKLDGSLCLVNRWDPVGCDICKNICHASAITLNGRIEINEDQCDGCGGCVAACPTGVFSFAGLDPITYLREYFPKLSAHGFPFIACRQQMGNYAFLPPCIGLFSGEAMAVAALELKKDIIFYTGGCYSCRESFEEWIKKQMSQANTLLALLGASWKIQEIRQWDRPDLLPILKKFQKEETAREALSRRGFFNFLKKGSLHAAATAIHGDQAQEAMDLSSLRPRREKFVPEERKKLVSLLQGRQEWARQSFEESELPFYKLDVSDDCTLCNICHDFCPTGALRKYEEDFEAGLEFDISRCVRCVDCGKLCPKGAITRSGHVDGRDVRNAAVFRMVRKELRECTDCEMKFLPDGGESKCYRCGKLGGLADIKFSF